MAITTNDRSASPVQPVRRRPTRALPAPFDLYQSAVGKKWVMAITGLMQLGFVAFHLFGNLKLYLSAEEINLYGESLRGLGGHLVPHTFLLWLLRLGLIGAFVMHIHAAYSLQFLSAKTDGPKYQSKRDWIAADWASRTMRWTGPIILAYIVFHLADLTWGKVVANDWVRGDPYNNLVLSMQRPLVALLYIVANVALALHLYHGIWSMFQSLGVNNPRFNAARRYFATGLAAVILLGNLSFPILIQFGLVEKDCEARVEVMAHAADVEPEAFDQDVPGCDDDDFDQTDEEAANIDETEEN